MSRFTSLPLTFAAIGLVSLGASGCLFPDYTFTESSGGAGGKGSSVSTTASTVVSSSMMSSTSMSSSTGGPVEDCFNGVDDDGDMLADCDDPDCEPDTQCVDPIPTGWANFGYVVLGEGGSTAPTCPSYAQSTKYAGNASLSNTGFSCSNCGCDDPINRDCNLTTDLDGAQGGLQLFQVRNVACANPNATSIKALTSPNPWNLSCDASSSAPGGQQCSGSPCDVSLFAGAPTVSGGMCNANGGVLNKSTPQWMTSAVGCGGIPALVGCTGGQKCMPKPQAPFFSSICIGKAGDQMCPDPYKNKHLYFKSYTDDRSCSQCSCGAPSGGSCGITITAYSDGACSAPLGTFLAGDCLDLTGNPPIGSRNAAVTDPPSGGSCSPNSVTSSKLGDVVPNTSSATTFCCL